MHVDVAGTGADRFFFWNVDEAVGRNGVNLMDDVLFVSWCLYKMRDWEYAPPATKAVLRSAPITQTCSGRDDDPLVVAIRAIQTLNPRMLVDGRVSPAVRGGTYRHRGHDTMFIIFVLNNVLKMRHPQQYPRLDLMPEFAWQLRAAATRPFIG